METKKKDILLNGIGIILGILIKRKEHYGRKQRWTTRRINRKTKRVN